MTGLIPCIYRGTVSTASSIRYCVPLYPKIMDIPGEESDAILTYLFQHMARQEFQVRFQWRDNSIAFWDNRCTQHLVMWDYLPEERYGHRVTVKGDAPFFRPH